MHQPATAKPDPRIRRWIQRELEANPPRASSLVITVWGDALAPHGGGVWLSTLFRLLAPFGINERLARTSVFRLARDGWLVGEAVGRRSRYRLTPDGARRFAQAYQRIYTPPSQPWDGSWEIVLTPADASEPDARRTLRDELAWEGFATFSAGAYARPARAASALPRIIAALDLARAVTVFTGRDAPNGCAVALADRVREAWDIGTLEADYQRFIARFAGVIEALRNLAEDARDPEQAFIVRTLLVHAYRRVRLRDPQLPVELLAADWPGAAAYALCRDFYRLAQPLAESHFAAVAGADGQRIAPMLPEFRSRFVSD